MGAACVGLPFCGICFDIALVAQWMVPATGQRRLRTRIRGRAIETPSVELRHVCRRCGRHFLLCEAEGCRPAVMPIADAMADAETLRVALMERDARANAGRQAKPGWRGASGTLDAKAASLLSTIQSRASLADLRHVARRAARAVFRVVPGLRESEPRASRVEAGAH